MLNEHFVSIKVDREERPDVDRVYMTFVQATTGSGGWPMSVWLTPELKPFYGGTYFPPTSRWGRPGFVDILAADRAGLAGRRAKVAQSAEALTAQLRADGAIGARATGAVPGGRGAATDGRAVPAGVRRAARRLRRRAEVSAAVASCCSCCASTRATGDAGRALTWCCATLRAMALGGMRDHIGGGFHRYSVDAAWRVPHFEKMLYDQAQLVLAYVEAAQASGDPFYLEVAEDTLLYVLREMTDPTAASTPPRMPTACRPSRRARPRAHKTEGAFYLWRADEVDALLGEDAPIVKQRFGIEPGGNAPSGSAAGVHRQEPAVHRAIDRRAGRRVRRSAATRSSRRLNRAPRHDVPAAAGAAAAAPRRQGAHRLERADDRRVRPHGARAGGRRPRTASRWPRRT